MIDTDRCPVCGKCYHTGGGRSLNLTDDQILGILTHCRAELPKHTIKHFCEEIGISTYTYRSIVRMTLKQPHDIARVLEIKAKLDAERK
ncbi:hypothetical protein [Clostridium beijerinckii]|uniref:Transposase n=1 Tax=Clostridium beijerinckii TaxID=1520 RepID=A0AAW3W608_CLOBE|nr:hypothetical protein [Clostridium beijerinckii]MBC2457161.1 hypothetical protein [Clostridium beijerinckii]MBC2474217.1 hypothetical protein [Clostridium beijerinckii]NOV58684.1 hypothetical protein [Clostridium beijerinckii]NOV71931.1 hypothetical protein [Clostridium beijerinckii]NOW32039.1 hypothetical protein [Clostridium beijerinckii]